MAALNAVFREAVPSVARGLGADDLVDLVAGRVGVVHRVVALGAFDAVRSVTKAHSLAVPQVLSRVSGPGCRTYAEVLGATPGHVVVEIAGFVGVHVHIGHKGITGRGIRKRVGEYESPACVPRAHPGHIAIGKRRIR